MSNFLQKFKGILLIPILLNVITIACAQSVSELFFQDVQYDQAYVETVRSADRIRLRGGEIIKLIGVKTPKLSTKQKQQTGDKERDQYGFVIKPENSPVKPLEELAFNYTKELLEGKTVRIEFDNLKKDENSETLGYVFIGEENLFVNEELLRQGFAYLQTDPVNSKYTDQLKAAYKEARDEFRGVHGE